MVNAFGLGAWGLLPFVVPLFVFVAAQMGALAAGPEGTTSDRAVAGSLLSIASVVVTVRALSLVHAVTTTALIAALVTSALTLALAARGRRFPWAPVRPAAGGYALLVVTTGALGFTLLAARWLPVWPWDSLGYHLPFVHFTLAARSVDGVPRELEYIGSYPHDVELFFVALRACLPDDRLVDLGQLPFGVAGAIVTASLACRWGASREIALFGGASWLLVPAVFLQLPTDYVDVATAFFLLAAIYWVLAPPSFRTVAFAAVALGLLVGSKPSAPLPVALLFAILAVRSFRAGLLLATAMALVLVLLLGGESYAENIALHHNPIWPVRFDLGPLHLPGPHPISELLAAGANAPRLTGPLPSRMVRSLFALTSMPAFDMRVGGFGVVVLAALPVALVWFARRRSVAVWLALLATLLSPDPAIARYVLAFPALLLAAAAAWIATKGTPRTQAALGALLAVSGAGEVLYAARGLTGEGPPLLAYASMTDDERALAVGADGPPVAIAAARPRVRAGEAFAFDEHMDLSDLAFDPKGDYRVVFLSTALSPDEAGRLLADERVRVFVAGDDAPAGLWAASHPDAVERLPGHVSCREGKCGLYARREPADLSPHLPRFVGEGAGG